MKEAVPQQTQFILDTAVATAPREFIVQQPEFVVGPNLPAVLHQVRQQIMSEEGRAVPLIKTTEVKRRNGKKAARRVVDSIYAEHGPNLDWVNLFQQAKALPNEIRPVSRLIQTETAVGNLFFQNPSTQASSDQFLRTAATHFSQHRDLLVKRGKKGRERLTTEGKMYADSVHNFLTRQFPTLDRTQLRDVIASTHSVPEARLLRSSLLGKRKWDDRKAYFESMTHQVAADAYQSQTYIIGGEKQTLSGAARLNYEISQRIREEESKLGYAVDVTAAAARFEVVMQQTQQELQKENDKFIVETVPPGLRAKIRAGWNKFRQDLSDKGFLRTSIPYAKKMGYAALVGAVIGVAIGVPLALDQSHHGNTLASNLKPDGSVGNPSQSHIVYEQRPTSDYRVIYGNASAATSIPAVPRPEVVVTNNSPIPASVEIAIQPVPTQPITRVAPVSNDSVSIVHPVSETRLDSPKAEPTPNIKDGQKLNMIIGDSTRELVATFDNNENPNNVAVTFVPPNSEDSKPTVFRFHSGYLKSIGDLPGTILKSAFKNHQQVIFEIDGINYEFVAQQDPIEEPVQIWDMDNAAWKAWAEKNRLNDQSNKPAVILTFCDKWDPETQKWKSAIAWPGHLVAMTQ